MSSQYFEGDKVGKYVVSGEGSKLGSSLGNSENNTADGFTDGSGEGSLVDLGLPVG